MVKILYVSAAAERGGLEVVLLTTLRCLDRTRFTPLVVLLDDGPLVRELEDAGATVKVVRSGRVRNLWRGAQAVATISRLIEGTGVNLVHTYSAKAHLYGGIAAARLGIPTLYHLHGVPRPSLGRDGVISLLSVLIPARMTIACSGYVAAEFGRSWRSSRIVAVVHNGVPVQDPVIPDDSAPVREEFGVPISAPLVVMVSRLQRWKGVHVFLEAAASVARQMPEAHFMVVGGALFALDQDYAAGLHDRVDRLGLAGRVRLVGHRSDVAGFFAAADVVVHASIEPDPFPMVLLEAMAAGKPVIASGLGGPRESVENGVTGLLVPPNNPEHLARAILTLLNDPERMIRMGKAGATRVRERFSAERMVRQLEALYEGMVGPPAANP
jgi:glycosyltransferase involved in cell wall biosynthesis